MNDARNRWVGLALRAPMLTLQQLTNAVPVRLSTFSTNFVSVDYAIDTPDATLVASKHDEEAIREVVRLLQERGWTEYL